MITGLLLIAYCLFALLAWKNLRAGIAVVIALLPSYLIRFSIGPFPTTFLEGLIIISTAAWILKNWETRKLYSHRLVTQLLSFPARNAMHSVAGGSVSIPLFLFLVATIISIFVSPNWYAAIGLWRAYILEPLLFFFIFLDTAQCERAGDAERGSTAARNESEHGGGAQRQDPPFIESVMTALAISSFLISSFAIYQYFTGWMIPHPWQAWDIRRVTSIFPYPNALGLYLAPIIVLLTGQILNNKQKVTQLLSYGVTVLLSFLALIFAQSHGAIVGTITGLLILSLVHRRLRVTAVLLCFLAVTFVSVYTPWRTYIVDRALFRTPSGKVRITQYKETWNMLRDGRWFLGSGFGGYKKTVRPYHTNKRLEIYMYPHSIVLNFWTETGLLGLLSILWLIIAIFVNGIKNLKLEIGNWKLGIPALAAFTALLTHGLVDVPFFKNDLAILWWVVIALVLIANKPLSFEERAG